MPSHQSAVSTLIREVLADPDLAHDDVFRRLLQAGLQDLVDAEAAAVISMGGYNTVCEILATDTPALVVPRETPRLEQLIRAEALRDARALDVMRAPQVTAEALGDWVADAVTRRVDRSHISRDGLAATADFAADLLSDANPAVQEVVA